MGNAAEHAGSIIFAFKNKLVCFFIFFSLFKIGCFGKVSDLFLNSVDFAFDFAVFVLG